MYETIYLRFGDVLWLFVLLGLLLAFLYRRVLAQQSAGRKLLALVLFLYLLALLNLTLFPLSLTFPPFGRPLSSLLSVAFPLQDLFSLLTAPGGLHPAALVRNIAGNFFLFTPFGFLVAALQATTWKGVAAKAFFLAAGIELAQLVVGSIGGTIRIVSSDDVLLNVGGALFGYLFLRAVQGMVAARVSEERLVQAFPGK